MGPQRPGNGGNVAIVIIAAIVVLLGGGGVAWWLLGSDDSDSTSSSASSSGPSTLPTLPSPPSITPFPTPYSGSGTDTVPGSGTYTPPETYTPPPEYWGSIAVAYDGTVGRSWDYSSRSGAERRAMKSCGRSTCKVLVTFVNGCGAVAFNSRTNLYWGGNGDTRSAAQRNAISRGGGRAYAWQCTTR